MPQITPLAIHNLGGGHTHTHTHTHTHAYIRTEVILRNQARAWFKKQELQFTLTISIMLQSERPACPTRVQV